VVSKSSRLEWTRKLLARRAGALAILQGSVRILLAAHIAAQGGPARAGPTQSLRRPSPVGPGASGELKILARSPRRCRLGDRDGGQPACVLIGPGRAGQIVTYRPRSGRLSRPSPAGTSESDRRAAGVCLGYCANEKTMLFGLGWGTRPSRDVSRPSCEPSESLDCDSEQGRCKREGDA
jgi:hypothetical protein